MKKIIGGFTLIEMLVTTAIFAGLAVMISSAVIYSMRSSKKSESAVKVRGELENALARVERNLREAKPNTVTVTSNNISFKNQDDANVNIVCQGSPLKLLMGGLELTSSNMNLTGCSFSYNPNTKTVTISLTGVSSGSVGVESDQVTVSSNIVLRNY